MSDNELALNNSCPDFTDLLPRKFLQQVLVKYPDIDKSDIIAVFQQSLDHCKTDQESVKVYDFCIIASDNDIKDAQTIKNALESQLAVKGCMYGDLCRPGREVFDIYDEMMDKSCKILFLITNNFCEDHFFKRVQNAAVFQCLIDKASKSSLEKCVPVFRHSEQLLVRIPLGLRGISGIRYREISDANLYKQYFLGITKIREKLHEKMFKTYCVEYVSDKVVEFIETQKEEQLAIENAERRLALQQRAPPPPHQSSSNSLLKQNSSNALMSSNDIQHLKEVFAVFSPASRSSEVSCQQMLSNASVTIQGEGNHIGTRNEFNININFGNNHSSEDEDSSG